MTTITIHVAKFAEKMEDGNKDAQEGILAAADSINVVKMKVIVITTMTAMTA